MGTALRQNSRDRQETPSVEGCLLLGSFGIAELRELWSSALVNDPSLFSRGALSDVDVLSRKDRLEIAQARLL